MFILWIVLFWLLIMNIVPPWLLTGIHWKFQMWYLGGCSGKNNVDCLFLEICNCDIWEVVQEKYVSKRLLIICIIGFCNYDSLKTDFRRWLMNIVVVIDFGSWSINCVPALFNVHWKILSRVADLVKHSQIDLLFELPKVLGFGFGLGLLELMSRSISLSISYLKIWFQEGICRT